MRGLSLLLAGITLAACTRTTGTALPANPLAAALSPASTFNYATMYKFNGGSDASTPLAGLVQFNGLLYGTTYGGGATSGQCKEGCGTVYSIDPNPSYAEKVIHRFSGGPDDGAFPEAGLRVYDGAFYGTTFFGGETASSCYTDRGCGTVFKMSPSGIESWKYAFKGSSDGANPAGGLVMAANGLFYGTTEYGGSSGYGSVFSVSTSGQENVIYSFNGPPNDGAYPVADVVAFDGELYGVTRSGGENNVGTVFSVTPAGAKRWLYNLDAAGGDRPVGLIEVDNELLGAASADGPLKRGTLFSISTSGTSFQIVHTFSGYPQDGIKPLAAPIATNGLLLGTTFGGGSHGDGLIYGLTTSKPRKECFMHSFPQSNSDGLQPAAPLLIYNGVLYGTTVEGGNYSPSGPSFGTVFRISPC